MVNSLSPCAYIGLEVVIKLAKRIVVRDIHKFHIRKKKKDWRKIPRKILDLVEGRALVSSSTRAFSVARDQFSAHKIIIPPDCSRCLYKAKSTCLYFNIRIKILWLAAGFKPAPILAPALHSNTSVIETTQKLCFSLYTTSAGIFHISLRDK